jgi:hypothetical protein
VKVSGFTIVRNGTRFDYPFMESLASMLPLVDELIVNVGAGEDDTLQKIDRLSRNEPKIKWFESRWPLDDPEKNRSGLILSEQTNLALDRCTGDWCLYLQADEVLHEEDYSSIQEALIKADPLPDVDGLLFDYIHFYGSFDVIQQTRSAYRREVRAIRRLSGARSVGDAQSFRKAQGRKLPVIGSGARIFHYGWVRSPEAMRKKTFFMDQLYHGQPKPQDSASETPHSGDNYRYKRFWGLRRYDASHPAVMSTRISSQGWHWDLENSPFVWNFGDVKKIISDVIERATGWRPFEYRSYKLMGCL